MITPYPSFIKRSSVPPHSVACRTNLKTHGNLGGWLDVQSMLPGAMMHASDCKGRKDNEEGLTVLESAQVTAGKECQNTQARSARPSSQPKELLPITARQYVRKDTVIVVSATNRPYTAKISGPRPATGTVILRARRCQMETGG